MGLTPAFQSFGDLGAGRISIRKDAINSQDALEVCLECLHIASLLLFDAPFLACTSYDASILAPQNPDMQVRPPLRADGLQGPGFTRPVECLQLKRSSRPGLWPLCSPCITA